jgi:hypothetical protein
LGHIEPIDACYVMFCLDPGASVKKVRNCIGAADWDEYRQAAGANTEGLGEARPAIRAAFLIYINVCAFADRPF